MARGAGTAVRGVVYRRPATGTASPPVARHIQFGKSPEQAEAWMRAVDEPNAERIEKVRHKADLVVAL